MFGNKKGTLLFGSSIVMVILLYHHCSIVRYAMAISAMFVEMQFLPEPEGLVHDNFTFPSVEERVQYYMGSWYNRTNYDGKENQILCLDVPVFRPDKREVNNYFDRPYIFDARTLRTLRLKQWSKAKTAPYEHDALKYFHGDYFEEKNNRSSRIIISHNMVFQFGDGMVLGQQTYHPVLVKARSAYNIPDTQTPSKVPILALINENRHYGQLSSVRQYFPWNEKKDTVVFRGVSTGNRLDILQPFITIGDPSGVAGDFDFAFTKVLQKRNDTAGMKGGVLTTKQLTQYKYLLVLPGNDVSSGLKWMLYSDSVVIMPHPQKVSYAMEEYLVPYVHYIPVREDLSDLKSQVRWARKNDGLCQNISKYATQYMMDLYVSNQAQEDNRNIRRLISEKYQTLYGPIISQCL